MRTEQLSCNLPEKLSTGLRMAVADLEKIEKDPRYLVNMYAWHTPLFRHRDLGEIEVVCQVCFGGAVLAKTCDTPLDQEFTPNSNQLDNTLKGKIEALDSARTGEVADALFSWYATADQAIRDRVEEAVQQSLEKGEFHDGDDDGDGDYNLSLFDQDFQGDNHPAEYGSRPQKFKEDMLRLAAYVEALGF